MWGTIVSALCNPVEGCREVGTGGARWPPASCSHEGCSSPTEGMDPGCEELGETEGPCEWQGRLSSLLVGEGVGLAVLTLGCAWTPTAQQQVVDCGWWDVCSGGLMKAAHRAVLHSCHFPNSGSLLPGCGICLVWLLVLESVSWRAEHFVLLLCRNLHPYSCVGFYRVVLSSQSYEVFFASSAL